MILKLETVLQRPIPMLCLGSQPSIFIVFIVRSDFLRGYQILPILSGEISQTVILKNVIPVGKAQLIELPAPINRCFLKNNFLLLIHGRLNLHIGSRCFLNDLFGPKSIGHGGVCFLNGELADITNPIFYSDSIGAFVILVKVLVGSVHFPENRPDVFKFIQFTQRSKLHLNSSGQIFNGLVGSLLPVATGHGLNAMPFHEAVTAKPPDVQAFGFFRKQHLRLPLNGKG